MKRIRNKVQICVIYVKLMSLLFLMSCSKFLNEPPDSSIAIITKLSDLQALLRDYSYLNNLQASLTNVGSDEYYLTASAYAGLNENYRNYHTWRGNTGFGGVWDVPYRLIRNANTVLLELERIKSGTDLERNTLRGEALFFRAFAYYQLAQIYCKPYSESADVDLGLPLRLTPNLEANIDRSTLEETYRRIILDTKEAMELLPLKNIDLNLPGKLASYGLMARVYLSMADYSNAEKYSNYYLDISPDLMDFNELDSLANPSISMHNIESTFLIYYTGSIPARTTTIDTSLIKSYDLHDLRRVILFTHNSNGTSNFKGSYQGVTGSSAFCGLATDEVYLIRAECRVRLNDIGGGLGDLNTLLSHRWRSGYFVQRSTNSKEEALEMVLSERRKELIFRSTRWSDLRRLNLEGRNISIKRVIGTETFTLQPNDKRWVWLIPEDVIRLSGIAQNER